MSEVKANKISPATSTVVTLGDSSDTFVVTTGAKIDINGTELILDADADTSITADTDDQIDIRIAGADDFQFTANTFTAAASSVVALDDGAVTTPALTNTGDLNTGIYFPAADTVGVTAGGTEQFRFGSNPIPGGSKNMLINGNMAVDQRGTATGIGGSDSYTLDRWKLDDTGGCQARYTVTQGANGGVSGKEPWMSITVTTAEAAEGSAEKDGWNQFIEGNNTRQIVNSSGQIKATTLSFDVKFAKGGGSSLSAPYTMCVGVYAGDVDYMWIEEISITADDTWEHKSFTTTALAQAASALDTSQGYRIQFMMLAGSDYTDGSAGWNSGGAGKPATTNQDNLADATSNVLGITNVQWEVGSVATDFAHEDYATTFWRCSRYYQKYGGHAASITYGMGTFYANNAGAGVIAMAVGMRAAATAAASAAGDFRWTIGSDTTLTSISFETQFSSFSDTFPHFTVFGGVSGTPFTAGYSARLRNVNADAVITLDAEL